MNASKRKRIIALACVLTASVSVLLAGCKEETPKPSAPGYYDGPMKSKADASSAAKTTATAPKGNAAGEP